jgi:hypothetical protein
MDKYVDEATYYHVRAAEMMAKAQEASSKATRLAYLNLARVWARKAASLEKQDLPPVEDGRKAPTAGEAQKV